MRVKVRWFPEQRITVLDDLTSSDEDDDDDDDGNGRGKKKGRKANDGGNVAIGGYFFEYDGKLEHSLGCEATIVRNARDANVKRRTYFSPYLGKCIAPRPYSAHQERRGYQSSSRLCRRPSPWTETVSFSSHT